MVQECLGKIQNTGFVPALALGHGWPRDGVRWQAPVFREDELVHWSMPDEAMEGFISVRRGESLGTMYRSNTFYECLGRMAGPIVARCLHRHTLFVITLEATVMNLIKISHKRKRITDLAQSGSPSFGIRKTGKTSTYCIVIHNDDERYKLVMNQSDFDKFLGFVRRNGIAEPA